MLVNDFNIFMSIGRNKGTKYISYHNNNSINKS